MGEERPDLGLAGGVHPSQGYATVEPDGSIRLPPQEARRLGMEPGARVCFQTGEHALRLRRPVTSLARVYVEPTNACNLECRTCVRRVWQEPLGIMAMATFQRVADCVQAVHPRPEIFFGGFGEPLGHPQILAMVATAHEVGARTELISNGVLLDEAMARGLIEAGLDLLWVSLDGVTSESYLDVRLGDELPRIVENLRRLRCLRHTMRSRTPQLGIAFVAMKRNIRDLPEVFYLGRRLGARRFHVSNVLPHTEQMRQEALYTRGLWESGWGAQRLGFPRMDASPEFLAAWAGVAHHADWAALLEPAFGDWADTCPFVARGSASVRWDGQVSPCLPLLHTHDSYLDQTRRRSEAYFVGSLRDSSLLEIWRQPPYVGLRERLQDWDFSPCTSCNSCEMAESNAQDCFGSEPPACGGCLWAQGFIRCP